MLTHMLPHRLPDVGRLANARNLRTHAELLRDGAETPALTAGQRTALLRDAEAAERQALRQFRGTRTRRQATVKATASAWRRCQSVASSARLRSTA